MSGTRPDITDVETHSLFEHSRDEGVFENTHYLSESSDCSTEEEARRAVYNRAPSRMGTRPAITDEELNRFFEDPGDEGALDNTENLTEISDIPTSTGTGAHLTNGDAPDTSEDVVSRTCPPPQTESPPRKTGSDPPRRCRSPPPVVPEWKLVKSDDDDYIIGHFTKFRAKGRSDTRDNTPERSPSGARIRANPISGRTRSLLRTSVEYAAAQEVAEGDESVIDQTLFQGFEGVPTVEAVGSTTPETSPQEVFSDSDDERDTREKALREQYARERQAEYERQLDEDLQEAKNYARRQREWTEYQRAKAAALEHEGNRRCAGDLSKLDEKRESRGLGSQLYNNAEESGDDEHGKNDGEDTRGKAAGWKQTPFQREGVQALAEWLLHDRHDYRNISSTK
jgi:hypothetical protein